MRHYVKTTEKGTDMKTDTIADKLFKYEQEYLIVREAITDDILKIFKFTSDDADIWPIDDIWFDCHDKSIEFSITEELWEPTQNQLNKIFELGFHRCWFNYPGGYERYVVAGSVLGNKWHSGIARRGDSVTILTRKLRLANDEIDRLKSKRHIMSTVINIEDTNT